jgi:hypothetical protein
MRTRSSGPIGEPKSSVLISLRMILTSGVFVPGVRGGYTLAQEPTIGNKHRAIVSALPESHHGEET